MSEASKAWSAGFLEEAVTRLYERDFHLVNQGLERAAGAKLACHLSRVLEDHSFLQTFPEIRVDVDYGREGDGPKRTVEGNNVVPDIIVHRPGPDGPNLAVIEIKGWWNKTDRQADELKLQGYLQKQHYQYAYFVELDRNTPEIRQISLPGAVAE